MKNLKDIFVIKVFLIKMRYFFVIICIFNNLLIYCQQQIGVISLDNDYNRVLADKLSNVYLYNGVELVKYDVNGAKKSWYSNKMNGSIRCVDVTNPFKILVLHKDFNKLVILNDKLDVLNEGMDLLNMRLYCVDAVCFSQDNNIWLYEERDNELVKIDNNGNVIYQTGNLISHSLSNINPLLMKERGDGIYVLKGDRTGIIVFDNYGNYRYTILKEDLRTISLSGRFMYVVAGKSVYKYDYLSKKMDKWFDIEKNFKDIWLQNDKMFLLISREVLIYRLSD